MAIASFDNTLRIWDVASLQLVDEIPISSGTRGFDWLDTNTVAVGVDNGRFNITEIEGITSDLTGTITLPSRTQGTAAYAVPLSVKLANSGGALVSEHSPTTDVNGTFTLQDLPQGSYGVWLKHDQSLAVMPSVSLDAPAVSLDFGTLAMGDANNSNHVNISDFSILSAAYGKSQGQSGYDARADFNGDNSVGTVDFSLLGSSYGQSGVPQPGIGGTGAFAAPPPTGTVNVLLRPANARARVGQTFTVTLRVRAGTQTVAGAAAYLTYDPALLQVVSVTPGWALPEVLQSAYDNASGHVDYGAGALTDLPRGTFTLAAVRFRAVAPTPGTAIQLAVGDPTRVTDVRYGDETVYGGGESVSVVVE
ncbi:MAG: cohesin domain-containing protein [Anaerolineae bacterium]|nr:cohesin domain-containing protein [Anaerolineae bacterium]